MPPTLPGSADASNKYEDLSGVTSASSCNPYDALIEACHDDSTQIQERYSTHRNTRNAQQKAQLLSPDFPGLIIDQILKKLEDPSLEPGYIDPRNCLVFWARPPPKVQSLVSRVQRKLQALAPNLWLMPSERLHMTALEITHSLSMDADITAITAQLQPAISTIVDYPTSHPARLIKPLLSYDRAAIALSFVPGGDESTDKYTYHHLRRDLYAIARSTGVVIESRYVVPSAHITIGRFLVQTDHATRERMDTWIRGIEDINAWLQDEFWLGLGEAQGNGETIEKGGEWVVGGLDLRKGRLWYGGGETIVIGKGCGSAEGRIPHVGSEDRFS